MRQQLLFATDLFEQAEVKEDLQPIIDLLRQAITDPWNDYRRRVQRGDRAFVILPPEGVAQWLHYQIVDKAARLVAEQKENFSPGDLITCEIKKIFVVEFKGTYKISFKKVNRRLERSNYRTKHQEEYWGQGLLPGYPNLIKLIVGYKIVNAGTTIQLYVTAPQMFAVAWSFELPAKGEARPLKIAEIIEQEEEPRKKGFKVKPKESAKKKNKKREDKA